MQPIFEIFGNNFPQQAGEPCDQLISADMVGLEVELENVSGPVRDKFIGCNYWTSVEDGSLRNLGREFIFRKPMGGSFVIDALKLLRERLDGTDVEASERTSFHVHVDVRDLNVLQLKTFMTLAVMFEEMLVKKTGDRSNNVFCCKFSTSDVQLAAVSAIDSIIPGRTPEALGLVEKYASVNMRRLFDQGSIEFRYHEGTLDTDRMLDWINTLLSFKVFARDFEGVSDDLLNVFSAGSGDQMMLEVLGKDLADKYYDENSAELMNKGMRIAQDAILLKRLEEDQPRIARTYVRPNIINAKIQECLSNWSPSGKIFE